MLDVGGGIDRLVSAGSRSSVPSVARFSGILCLQSISEPLYSETDNNQSIDPLF